MNKYIFSEAGELDSVPSYTLPGQCPNPIRVSIAGGKKMTEGLIKGKAPGADGLRKEDLLLDLNDVPFVFSHCMSYTASKNVMV